MTAVRHTDLLVLGLVLPLLASYSAGALTPGQHLSQYGHRSWRYQDGYFSGIPLSVAQTTDGYLWVGTSNGLERFDGARFVSETFASGERLPSAQIWSLLGDQDGSLWIGTEHGLARLIDGRLRNYPAAGASRIKAIRQAHDGAVWIAIADTTNRGPPLCRIMNESVSCFGPEQGLPVKVAVVLALGADGEVWLGADTALERWSATSMTATSYAFADLRNNAGMDGVVGLALDHQGSLWVAKTPTFPGSTLEKVVKGVATPFRADNLDVDRIGPRELFVDESDALWIGTGENGIYRVADGRAENFRDVDGLTGLFVVGLFEDRERTLWVLTTNGLDSFYDTRVVAISMHEGLDDQEVDGVHATRSGDLLIGGSHGLKILRSDGRTISPDRSLANAQISSIYEDHLGRIWAGVGNDLYVQTGDHASRIVAPQGDPIGLTSEVTEDATGTMWAESLRAGQRFLERIRDDRVDAEFTPQTVPPARSVVGDSNGAGLWLGLRSGDLAHFDGSTLKRFAFQHGPNERIHRVMLARDGAVLGATTYGLIGLRGGVQRTLDLHSGLPCLDVFAIAEDLRGNLWIPAECGLIEISSDQLARWWANAQQPISARLYDATDGMQPGLAPFEGATRTADGRLWFANGLRVQMVDPAHMVDNVRPPPVHIEGLSADRHSYAAERSVLLPALTRDIEIDYTALSLVAPEKVRFSYLLEGHDHGWVDAGHRRQAFYNDLAPGRYTFRVIASNNDGVWNRTGASQSFVIQPAFYQTLWFRVAVGVLLLCGLWFLYVMRVRSATAAVQARLGERLLERERIAREFHDTLLQGFQGLVLRFHAVLKQLANPDSARPMLEAALDRAEDVLRESRGRLTELRSEEGDAQELSGSLAEFGRSFTEHSATAFRLTLRGTPCPLNPALKAALVRIARESIANAFLHAEASNIEAEVIYETNALRLRVSDDGKGIAPEILQSGLAGHWGLANIRQDAHKIGAQILIRSAPGAGTSVELSIASALVYARPRTGRMRAWARSLMQRQSP
jgi:signal transduction histidine kinase/ligand-binding sensor domain-containing protein